MQDFVKLMSRRLSLFDVGARGGMGDPWRSFPDQVTVTGFEPDADECTRLNATSHTYFRTLPFALSNKKETRSLYILKKAAASSLLQPNLEVLSRYPDVENFSVVKEVPVELTSLELLEPELKTAPDFIKIDVQGWELNVLQGGHRMLADNLIGAEIEVEFVELYKGQPLFGDIDQFVRTQLGLELFDLRQSFWKHAAGTGTGNPRGQLVFGDALYFRPVNTLEAWLERVGRAKWRGATLATDPEAMHETMKDKLLSALFASLAYGYCDYALAAARLPLSAELLGHSDQARALKAIEQFGKAMFSGLPKNKHLANLFWYLYLRFQPMHRQWWYSTRGPGTRRRMGLFV